jgi:hypothetical protein
MFGWKMPSDILWHERRNPVVAPPIDEMCGISGADDIDCMDAADLLLTYALKIPLCS